MQLLDVEPAIWHRFAVFASITLDRLDDLVKRNDRAVLMLAILDAIGHMNWFLRIVAILTGIWKPSQLGFKENGPVHQRI